jgi:hypothetical protein
LSLIRVSKALVVSIATYETKLSVFLYALEPYVRLAAPFSYDFILFSQSQQKEITKPKIGLSSLQFHGNGSEDKWMSKT